MESWLFDVKLAIRSLLKQRTFLSVSVFTLALAVGAATAIFTVVYGVIIAPLDYPEEERLVAVQAVNPEESLEAPGNFVPDFWFWRENTQVLEEMAFYGWRSLILEEASRVERIESVSVSANVFSIFGMTPMLGRGFEAADEVPGVGNVALISSGMWARVFGSDPDVVGRTVRLSGRLITIIGVMPEATNVPSRQAELWIPVGYFESYESSAYGREERDFSVVARLAEGSTLQQAQAELDRFSSELAELYPGTNAGWIAKARPLKELIVGNARLPLILSFAAVALVLLIACTNVANLVLVRALGHSREMAVRSALGAGNARLARQHVIESLVLTSIGGALGVIVAVWLSQILLAVDPGVLPRKDGIDFGAPAIGFALVASLVCGIGFGLAAALHRSKSLGAALRVGVGQLGSSARQGKLRMVLAGTQLALALALLVGAGVLSRSLYELSRVDPGFRPEGTYASHILLSPDRYSDPKDRVLYFRRLVEEARRIPGIQAASITTTPPVPNVGIRIETAYRGLDGPLVSEPDAPRAAFRVVGASYFETVGIPLRSGRDFNDRDDFDRPEVVIVNETLARNAFGREDVVGETLQLYLFGVETGLEVVGVVGDTRFAGLHREPGPAFFLPHPQTPFFGMALVARSGIGPATYSETIRRTALSIDSSQPVMWVRSLETALEGSLDVERFYSALLSVFAFVAIAIAASGVYGVFAYWVEQRRREVGLRMAMGASPRGVVVWILKRCASVATPSILAGFGGAFLVSKALSRSFAGVSGFDPVVLVAATITLSAVVVVACYVPARRAAKIAPTAALRNE